MQFTLEIFMAATSSAKEFPILSLAGTEVILTLFSQASAWVEVIKLSFLSDAES